MDPTDPRLELPKSPSEQATAIMLGAQTIANGLQQIAEALASARQQAAAPKSIDVDADEAEVMPNGSDVVIRYRMPDHTWLRVTYRNGAESVEYAIVGETGTVVRLVAEDRS